MIMEKEKINFFIDSAYKCACVHGFHDVDRSDAHFMMLVLSEIGEMVEADRRKRFADKIEFMRQEEIRIGSPEEYAGFWSRTFEQFIKDTVEDELADVCIRLFDFCGTRRLTPLMVGGRLVDMDAEFGENFGGYTLCEQAYALCNLVTDVTETKLMESQERALGSVLSFIAAFARHHGIDLVWHVENKLRYNESRERLHGKKY